MSEGVSAGATAFEREKWEADVRLREQELTLKGDELKLDRLDLEHKHREERRSRWFNPLVLAIVAAALAGASNAYVAYLNGAAQRDIEVKRSDTQNAVEDARTKAQQKIEESKAEAARILEAIKTGSDSKQAATNLRFLTEVGLILGVGVRERVIAYLDEKKEIPALPVGGGARITAATYTSAVACSVPSSIDPQALGEAFLHAVVPDRTKVELVERGGENTYFAEARARERNESGSPRFEFSVRTSVGAPRGANLQALYKRRVDLGASGAPVIDLGRVVRTIRTDADCSFHAAVEP